MPDNLFTDHTLETAPADSRRSMEATIRQSGYLPAPVARLAHSPQLLDGFLKSSALFDLTALDPIAREVVVLTIATRNGCHVCVAMHTARLAALDAHPEVIAALRSQQPIDDRRLEAVQEFTREVLQCAGAVGPEAMQAFLDAGYTPRNALEVVLGIGAYTISTFANRMTGAPLDEPLAPFAWDESAA